MGSLQEHIMRDLQAKREIDPGREIQSRTEFLKRYLRHSGLKGYVLGISGGQDSTLVGWLAQSAVAQLRAEGVEARFVALRLPYGFQSDEEDAQLALKFINPDETHTIDIKSATDALVDQLASQGLEVCDFNKGNIKARQRMIVHYALAGDHSLAVLGSDHAAEAVTGFYTKFGDGAADVTPLAGLNKRQGKQILRHLGCPAGLYDKVPTADLLDDQPSQSDEDALRVSYEDIDSYLEGKTVSRQARHRIEELYLNSRHKRAMPVRPTDTWWHEPTP